MQREKISVIITSAGTASAISVIKALRLQSELEVFITAVDADLLAAGLYLADAFEVVPHATHPQYINELLRIAQKYNASFLYPIYSEEIRYIAENKHRLVSEGLKVFLSSPETIALCNDKRAMYAIADELKIQTPSVYSADELTHPFEISYPVFVKPNTGSSSNGAELVSRPERLRELLSAENDMVVQEFIDAEEVTVDVLCDENFEAISIAPRLRLATKSGQSVKGKTLPAEPYVEPIRKLCRRLELKGACNVQFFVRDEHLYFIEVNPRFAAGGLMLTVKAGVNIPLLLLKLALGKRLERQSYQPNVDFVMTRYWEEIVFEQNLGK